MQMQNYIAYTHRSWKCVKFIFLFYYHWRLSLFSFHYSRPRHVDFFCRKKSVIVMPEIIQDKYFNMEFCILVYIYFYKSVSNSWNYSLNIDVFFRLHLFFVFSLHSVEWQTYLFLFLMYESKKEKCLYSCVFFPECGFIYKKTLLCSSLIDMFLKENEFW